MDCEQAILLMSAELDGELAPGDRPPLDAHLAACESCRTMATAMRSHDAELRRAFAPRREAATTVADRVLLELPPAVAAVRPRFPWVPVVLSAAAGFLVAVLVFQPWAQRGPAISKAPVVGPNEHEPGQLPDTSPTQRPDESNRPTSQPDLLPATPRTQLVFAKGMIETLTPGDPAWRPLATGGAVEPGTRVRTDAKGRCEFRTPDGSEIRLNGHTELVFTTDRRLELALGQIWTSVAEAAEPFAVGVPRAEATVTALGTQFDIACTVAATVLTVVQGSTRVEGDGGQKQQLVRFGERATIAGGKVAKREKVYDLVLATSWVHEILTLKGHDDEELARRMDDMLAQIGKSKMDLMYEKEILQLGDHCVLPLTRFLQSDRWRGDKQKRANAARILAKIAQPWSVRDLITLLADNDAEVRFYAARALERLTDGVTHGLLPEQWRDAPADARRHAIERWNTWWEGHRELFPESPFLNDQPDLKK